VEPSSIANLVEDCNRNAKDTYTYDGASEHQAEELTLVGLRSLLR